MAKKEVIDVNYKETDNKDEATEKKRNKFLDFCSNHIVPVAGVALASLAVICYVLYTVFASVGDSDIEAGDDDKDDDSFDVDFKEVGSEDVTMD